MDTSEDDSARTMTGVKKGVGKPTQGEPVTTSTSNEQEDSGKAAGDATKEASGTMQPGPTPKPATDNQEDSARKPQGVPQEGPARARRWSPYRRPQSRARTNPQRSLTVPPREATSP
jgi:hypothetical protein